MVETHLKRLRRLKSLPPSILWIKFRTVVSGNVFGRFYLDTNHDIHQSLMISGTHRSGSTWLARLVNHQLHYRLIFEPVRHAKDKNMKAFSRRYVRPGEENSYLRERFERLLTGTERNYHLDKRNLYLFCKGRLLKGVSTNLLLKWFRREFPFVPIIFIIRNPFLVVSSCLKMNWLSAKEPDFWLSQEALIEDHLQPYVELIRSSKAEVEKYLLEWCILNFVPLQQFRDDEWKVIFYDDLVRNPEQGLKEIFDYLKMPYQDSVLERVALPSHTSEEAVNDRDHLLEKWKTVLSPEDQKTVERYAREFGLNRYLG